MQQIESECSELICVISDRLVVRRGQFQIHQIKINGFAMDSEKIRECTQLPKAVFFVQSDGAGIVAAHLQIQLLEAVFLGYSSLGLPFFVMAASCTVGSEASEVEQVTPSSKDVLSCSI